MSIQDLTRYGTVAIVALTGLLGSTSFGCVAASPEPEEEELTGVAEQAVTCGEGAPVVNSASAVLCGSLGCGQGTLKPSEQWIRVNWTAPSVAAPVTSPYDYTVRVRVPGKEYTTTVPAATVPLGSSRTDHVWLYLPLDGPIPCTVTVTRSYPGGRDISCSHDLTLTPSEPSVTLERHDSQMVEAGYSLYTTFTLPAATPMATYSFGKPENTNHQTVVSTLTNSWKVLGPKPSFLSPRPVLSQGSFPSVTTGYLPAFYSKKPVLSGAQAVDAKINVQLELSSVRVRKSALEAITWAQLNAAKQSSPYLTEYLGQDGVDPNWLVNDPQHPDIIQFVNTHLAGAQMGPYATARKLFIAVANAVVYYAEADKPHTAVDVLHRGLGDCGGYSLLLTSVLRAAGIPARIEYGQWLGGYSHVISNFWLPGVGWIPVDATSASAQFPHSGYAYYFGNIPGLNAWASFGYGNRYKGNGVASNWMAGPQVDNHNLVNPTWLVSMWADVL